MEIIDKLPKIGDRSLAEVINLRPKIIMSPLSALLEIQDLFTEHGITAEAISKYPEIYTLSPKTIRERLEEFNRIPEFTTLKSHPRVGRLIYYQNKVKKRLEYLQSAHQVFNSSLHILSSDTAHFERHLKHGELRTRGIDNVLFISNYLDIPKSFVRDSMRIHPHWRDVSAVTLQAALNYLTKTKSYSLEQIKYGLPILLYPVDKIMANIRHVIETKEAVETDLWFLQMVLYFIEKNVHFNGAGIWDNETSPRQNVLEEKDTTNREEHEKEDNVDAHVLNSTSSNSNKSGNGKRNSKKMNPWYDEDENPFSEEGELDFDKLANYEKNNYHQAEEAVTRQSFRKMNDIVI